MRSGAGRRGRAHPEVRLAFLPAASCGLYLVVVVAVTMAVAGLSSGSFALASLVAFVDLGAPNLAGRHPLLRRRASPPL